MQPPPGTLHSVARGSSLALRAVTLPRQERRTVRSAKQGSSRSRQRRRQPLYFASRVREGSSADLRISRSVRTAGQECTATVKTQSSARLVAAVRSQPQAGRSTAWPVGLDKLQMQVACRQRWFALDAAMGRFLALGSKCVVVAHQVQWQSQAHPRAPCVMRGKRPLKHRASVWHALMVTTVISRGRRSARRAPWE